MIKALDKFLEKPQNVFFALVLPVIALYFKSLYYGFTTLDEQWLVVRSSSFNSDWKNLLTVFHTPVSYVYYRPLFMVSIIIDHQIGQVSPFVYHVTNLLWHLLAVVLLYRFLTLSGSQKVKAYVITLLFALHPIAVHAVAWVPGRNDVMMACFALLSFNSLLRYLQEDKKWLLMFQVIFLILAFLTKETAVVIPFICLGIVFVYSEKKLRFYVLYSGLAVILTIVYFVLRSSVTETLQSSDRSLWLNLKEMFLAFFMQMGKAYYPLSQSVSPVLNTALSLFGILVFILSLIVWKRSKLNFRKATLAWFIFVGFMVLPVWFGVAKGSGEHYEHRIYCSLIGLALFFSGFDLRSSSNGVRWGLISLLVLFALTTSVRMKVYANEEVFVDAGMKERPDYYLFYLQKGDQLNNRNNLKAIEYYNKAIELRPDYGTSYANRGSAFLNEKMFAEALEDYNQATMLNGFHERTYFNRCYCHVRLGNAQQAKNDLDTLRKYSPDIIEPQMEQIVNEMYKMRKDSLEKK